MMPSSPSLIKTSLLAALSGTSKTTVSLSEVIGSKELKTKTEFSTAYNSLLIDLFGNKDNISFADYNIYIQYNESLHEYEILLIIGDYNAQVIAHYIEPKIKTFPGYIRAQS